MLQARISRIALPLRASPLRASPLRASKRSSSTLTIGDLSYDINKNGKPRSPPPALYLAKYLNTTGNDIALSRLQWMAQKDIMQQDMFLLGPPGVSRRNLVMAYGEMTNRDVHVVSISQDTTESDLKQRRELVNNSAIYNNQAPVTAALNGSLLLLDNVQNAERNILPVLNNLLENRELNLEDNTMLVSHSRYKNLLEGGADVSFLRPTHPDFRIIATGVPVPPYPGNTLDPPLRSRFQAMRVNSIDAVSMYNNLVEIEQIDPTIAKPLCNLYGGLLQAGESTDVNTNVNKKFVRMTFPSTSIPNAAKMLSTFPGLNKSQNVLSNYLYFLNEDFPSGGLSESAKKTLASFQVAKEKLDLSRVLGSGERGGGGGGRGDNNNECTIVTHGNTAAITFKTDGDNVTVENVQCGSRPRPNTNTKTIHENQTHPLLIKMLQHVAVTNSDLLLISNKGEGKTRLAKAFATALSYETEVVNLYKDISSRDLVVMRKLDTNKEDASTTAWQYSPLIDAAVSGKVCILDGLETISPDSLLTLQSLLTDREIQLPNGEKLIRHDRYELIKNNDPNGVTNLTPIHPSFRVIGLGTIANNNKSSSTKFLTEDVATMFTQFWLSSPNDAVMRKIFLKEFGNGISPATLDKILKFRSLIKTTDGGNFGTLSLRNLLRVGRKINNTHGSDEALVASLSSVMNANLLPKNELSTLRRFLADSGIDIESVRSPTHTPTINSVDELNLPKLAPPANPQLVPSPKKFFDIAHHLSFMEKLLTDMFDNEEKAILLIGNQGVGKNMIVDRLLQLCNMEREYIQLHRDSTVGQLTLTPNLVDGKIVWEDSPLIKAVKNGRVLMIDEADKAPLDVVAVLKSLIEDGEMRLADGRRIVSGDGGENENEIVIHKNFKVIVLANRPGYPFLGNDFFGSIGDIFSSHVITNPPLESEIELLTNYAPNVKKKMIIKLAKSFAELRELNNDGEIKYPYSTREAVGAVRHLQQFPNEGIEGSLKNLLDFDTYDPSLMAKLHSVFLNNGIVLPDVATMVRGQWGVKGGRGGKGVEDRGSGLTLKYRNKDGTEGKSFKPPGLKDPKFGQWDDKNEAHVGGSNWAGGTGGSNTAGLGGRGGPFRLDRGHKVHQVSDEAKAEVSEESQKLARQMAEEALAAKLAEIEMGEGKFALYEDLVGPIRSDIDHLRGSLSDVEAKKLERAWLKGVVNGNEIDDSRIVDAAIGEKAVYKKRGFPDGKSVLVKPKRIRFVFDCSGSMYRFNGLDNRLNRSLEAAALIMEGFEGSENRFDYSIVGHSGDGPKIDLVKFGKHPQNENERLKVLRGIVANTQYCRSGDYTIEGIEEAIVDCREGVEGEDEMEEADECIVVALSDANMKRYGITVDELSNAMVDPEGEVTTHFIAIASLGQEAVDIQSKLEPGHAHFCNNTSDMPKIIRELILSVST